MISIDLTGPPPPERPRRTARGDLFRLIVWGLSVAVAAVVGLYAWDAVRQPTQRRPPRRTNPPPTTVTSQPPAPAIDDQTSAQATAHVPPKLALDQLEQSIVTIESRQGAQPVARGSGFVVGQDRLIATNYHVVADSLAASVRFKNGAAYDVEGYAAIDPQFDLALLQLRDLPPDVRPLDLADDSEPERLTPVVAIGHPRGLEYSIFEGMVSRTVLTSQLPASSRDFLRQLIDGRADHRWIQHTAGLSEGNSGGPLLDRSGHVLGINTWVDRDTRFGYALHASQVRELLDQRLPKVAPLTEFARPDVRRAELLRQLTPQRIEQLAAQAHAMAWRPESEADYQVLQEVAWVVTAVQLPSTFTHGELDERRDELTVACDRLVNRLAGISWDAIGQVTIVNEHAAAEVFRPRAGLFLFATVERIVEGDDGTRAALARLAGADQILFLPLDAALTVPEPGQQCLVLGVNYDGNTVRYGDNPLRLITAPVVATRTIIPLKLQ